MFWTGLKLTKLAIWVKLVNGIVTTVIVINEYNNIVNVCLPISIDFLDVTEYIAQKIADPIPAIIPIHEMSIEFSSRSPVTNVHPISTRITHNTLIEVIFSLNRKYSNTNTKTGAVLKSIAARDKGTVLMELL